MVPTPADLSQTAHGNCIFLTLRLLSEAIITCICVQSACLILPGSLYIYIHSA